VLDLAVIVVMLILGLLLGFVGVGGGGFISALLIILFHVPVHLAFGISLGAMFATATVGGWSHLREGNVEPVLAVQIGLAGVVGAYFGVGLALATSADNLRLFGGLSLIINSGIVYLRTRMSLSPNPRDDSGSLVHRWWRELPGSAGIGVVCGLGAGFLSVGTAPWIQVGLLVIKRTSLRTTIGTTMLSLALMSLTGAIRFAQGGQVDGWLLTSVVVGLSVGSFLGAKFTKRAPSRLVKSAMVFTPLMAGILLAFGPV
jgi:uncharacterized protein